MKKETEKRLNHALRLFIAITWTYIIFMILSLLFSFALIAMN